MPMLGKINKIIAYLARAPKSTAVYQAYEAVQKCVNMEATPSVPIHLRNAPTKLMQDLGFGRDYKYNPDHGYKKVDQLYLPPELAHKRFMPPIAPFHPPCAKKSLDTS